MGITLSHASALHTTRLLRASGANLREMDHIALPRPVPWTRKRWSMSEFAPAIWNWRPPSPAAPLDVLVATAPERLRMKNVQSHICGANLPADSIIWLDEHTSIPCPPLLFIQMAERASLPSLVLLGYELCGYFTRDADNPARGPITDNIPPATDVEEIRDYLDAAAGIAGMSKARHAIKFIADRALSAPEAVLATMYSLPATERGYGMGPVALNQRIELADGIGPEAHGARYPDILFAFAPMGINYDGGDHLNLSGLVKAARDAACAGAETKIDAERILSTKMVELREKAVDDIRRTRELAAQGLIIFPATKEDLNGWGKLDALTRQVLACARTVFGVDTSCYDELLEDGEFSRERQKLLESMLPPNASMIL